MRVVIAGAGIGGLTLAHALRRAGVDTRIFERAPDPGASGAGITVQCNAMTALGRIGLDRLVAAAGAELTEASILTPDGRVLSTTPLGRMAEELGAPFIGIHRARLHRVLLEAAGAEGVETGRAVAGYEQEAGNVRVRLSDGAEALADLLVGADGLRSVVRAQMLGDGEPLYAGYTSWRGVSPRADLVGNGRTSESWGCGRRFGIVPIGGGEVYWFAVADAPPGERDAEAHPALLERFGHWHAPIADLIRSTPGARILRTDISDRDPVSGWTEGRVVLLGDAAHPMTPNLGQGGCQAIEDAVVLAKCLLGSSRIEEALACYQRHRLDRANGIVLASRRMGRIAQLSHPAACWLRNQALRLTPRSAVLRRIRPVLTYPHG